MAGSRRQVRRVQSAVGARRPSVLERAVREIAEALPASAVYGYALARDGAYHCVAVHPPDLARPGNLDPTSAPQAIDLIYARTAARLDGWVEDGVTHDGAVLVPLWDDDGPVGAVVMLGQQLPTVTGLRMLSVHGRALGQALAMERELESASARVARLTQTGRLMTESLANLHEAVFALDHDGRVTQWSAGCERLMGWSRTEALGATMPMIAEARRAGFLHQLRLHAADGGPYTTQVELARKYGSAETVTITVLPLFGDDVEPRGSLLVCEPPERVWAAPGPLRDQYLASLVVRELTSPLTAITGYAQLLSRSGIAEDSDQRSRIARAMLARCTEMESLLEDLSLLGGIQSAPSFVPEEVDIVSMLRMLLERLNSTLTDERFSEQRIVGSGTALVDRACAERSLLGLVRSIGRTCSRESRVTFSVESADGVVSLTIETEEPSAAEADALLERLEHLATIEPVTEVGLGLHLARVVAEAHGGGVAIARRAHNAPSVTISLPAAPRGHGAGDGLWTPSMM